MDPAEYDYMFQLEDSLWWYAGMRRIVKVMLDRELPSTGAPLKILDAGCGTGGSLKLLERYGQVTGFDFSSKATEMYRSRQAGRIMVASTDHIPFADETFDLVTSFDVICQLKSPGDEMALQELSRVLKPGGTLLVRTPAFQWLYGPHDRTLQSEHRYSASELERKLKNAGLGMVRTTYANAFLFPIAVGRRLINKFSNRNEGQSDVRAMPGPVNMALEAVLSSEALIVKRTRLPLGLSVMAMAQKS